MDKKIFYKIVHGMYIVSSKRADKLNAQIANTVFQVTAQPPQFSVCINKNNLTHQLIRESMVFVISVLAQDTPMQFIGRFGFRSGRELDKLDGIEYKIGITGAPIIIQNCLGYLECEVTADIDTGTHTVFIGKVLQTQLISDIEPMTYTYYREIKNGKSPVSAPTYIKEIDIGRRS